MNEGFVYREIIGRGGAWRTLLAHLAVRYGHTPEAEWAERIAAGRVLLDGAPASASRVLMAGQELRWVRPPWREPEAPGFYAVLHEDAALVAVAKPSGLPTLPGGGFLENTLLSLVRRRYPGASPAHRLGRGTSGVVLFTRTAEAGRTVAAAWRDRRVTKVYRARVEGSPARDVFSVEAPIGPLPHPRLGRVHAASPGGKPSRSDVRVIERHGTASLVEVAITTGRPHQIRIHLAACGYPLVGDPLYAPGGAFRGKGAALPGDTGYLLHALRLVLPHPATGLLLRLECPPPRALRSQNEGM